MAKFRQYVVTHGDTIQSIAQEQLGDMNRWTEITKFNNLKHPYVVDTLEQKRSNPDHLVTFGDMILIDIGESGQNQLISALRTATEYDKEEVTALALGKDLDILPLTDIYGTPDSDSDNLSMKPNYQGGLKTVRGVENLKQALYIRLATPKGSYTGHPNFGSDLIKYLGQKNSETVQNEIDLEIERTLRTDGRVTNVKLLGREVTSRTYSVAFEIETISTEEAFEFVIEAQEDGIITLTDKFIERT